VGETIGKGASDMLGRIFRYSDLSWKDLTNIKRWFKRDEARNGFSLDSFNPSIRVARVENSVGQTVCFTAIENCYVVGAYIHNPCATSGELGRGGDAVDCAVSTLAQREGVSKFLIALPDHFPSEPGEKWIRVVEREVQQSVIMGGIPRSQASSAQFN
jgi:hypothetical protein